MNYKRALMTGVMLWVIIFVVVSILMFMPGLQNKVLSQHIIFWILLIPITLLLAKWHFRMDPPNIKKGLLLGVIMLVAATVLDSIITVPFFVKSYAVFFANPLLYMGYGEILILSVFAGFEFDKTFTKPEEK